MAATALSRRSYRHLVDHVLHEARRVGLWTQVVVLDSRRPRIHPFHRDGDKTVVYVPRAGRDRDQVVADMCAEVVAAAPGLDLVDRVKKLRALRLLMRRSEP